MAEELKNGKKEPEKKEIEKKDSEKKEKVKLGDKIKKFFKDYKSEMKKVVWPSRDQVIKNTSVVLVAIIFMATIIGILDLAFGFGVSRLTLIKDLFNR
jgi:preprotein translocase subunit SecE